MTSSIRNFIVIFLVALLLFGTLGHYVVNNAIPALLDGTSPSESIDSSVPSVDDSSAVISESEASEGEESQSLGTYTCVFFGTDVNGTLCSVNLAHVDDGYKTYIFSSIPANVKVENKSGIIPLSDIYKRNGAVYTVKKIEAMTGFSIDHYAIVSAAKGAPDLTLPDASVASYDLIKLFNEIGGISCSVKEDIIYSNPDYVPEPSESSDGSEYDSSLESSNDVSEELSNFDESSEQSEIEISEEVIPQEALITIPAGVYYINLDNYTTLMDSAINPYITDIFKNLFNRVFTNAALAKNTELQNSYLRYLEFDNFYDDKRAVAEILLFKYGSSDFKQVEIDYPTKGIGTADWEQAVRLYRNAVKSN